MFGVIWTGVTWESIALGVLLYVVRMFGVTAGYHRYFAHRSYETSRWFQFVLAILAMSAIQRGPLWWAASHRAHHLYSDTERDKHSPVVDGFLHAHFKWFFAGNAETEWRRVRDFARYPELVWLDKYWYVPPIIISSAIWAVFGGAALCVSFAFFGILVWHSTFFVNSLAHVWGTKRFDTGDESRNNLFIALLTMGEGWHNQPPPLHEQRAHGLLPGRDPTRPTASCRSSRSSA